MPDIDRQIPDIWMKKMDKMDINLRTNREWERLMIDVNIQKGHNDMFNGKNNDCWKSIQRLINWFNRPYASMKVIMPHRDTK